MITNQQQLENAGMGCLRRDSPPPKVDPRLKTPSLKVPRLKAQGSSPRLKAQGKSRINPSSTSHVDPSLRLKARTVLQREADARQDARDYQNMLVYTKSEYKDASAHWVQRPPAPLVRHKRTAEQVKEAQANLTQHLPQEVSRRRRRLKVKLQTPPRSRKISREFARLILKDAMKELES